MEKTNMISKSKRTLQTVKHIVINHKIVIITGMPFFWSASSDANQVKTKQSEIEKTEQREKKKRKAQSKSIQNRMQSLAKTKSNPSRSTVFLVVSHKTEMDIITMHYPSEQPCKVAWGHS